MATTWREVSRRGVIVALFLCSSLGLAESQERHPLAFIPEQLAFGSLVFRPAPPPNEPTVYQQYFETHDGGFSQLYQSRLQDLEPTSGPFNQSAKNILMGNTSVASTSLMLQESRMRGDLASAIMSTRLTTALETYTSQPDCPSVLTKAVATTQNAREVRVRLSSENEAQEEFRFGYDVMTDVTHLAYGSPRWDASIVVPQFLSGFIGQGALDLISFELQGRLDDRLPTASVGWRLNSPTMRLGLGKPLSSTVAVQLSTTQPVKEIESVASSYDLQFAISF